MRKIIALLVAVIILACGRVTVYGEYKNVFYRNREAKGKIALTFDDGPHPTLTPRILDLLDEYGITATFFVVGKNVENYPKAFERLLSSECEIGNHGYSHKRLENVQERDISEEISATERAVRRMTERKLSVLRPPQGVYGEKLQRLCMSLGYRVILWSIDTRDWAHNTPDNIAKTVLDNIRDGDIILMHDYVSGESPTCEALKIIIPQLLSRGYEFVSVSELIEESEHVR